MTRIFILGGGFGGVNTYLQLHRRLHPCDRGDVRIELINRTNYLTFTPMLHEAATGSVAREHVVQPLREIINCPTNDFHQAEIQRVDVKEKVIHTSTREYHYDILVVALGVQQGFFNVPGAEEHAYPLKTFTDAVRMRNRIINAYEHASEHHDKQEYEKVLRHLCFVVVGGGATGTELAGQLADLTVNEMRDFYRDVPHDKARIVLVHSGKRLLETMSEKSSEVALQQLRKLGVDVMLQERAVEVQNNSVALSSGTVLSTSNVFWTAGTETSIQGMFPREMLDEHGRIVTDEYRRAKGYEDIFALGDCAIAEKEEYRTPPTAQAAVWESRCIARTITAQLKNQPLCAETFHSMGEIVPIGDWFGVYERGNISFAGKLVWLLRRAVFIRTMYTWSRRLRVLADWSIQITQPRDTSEL